MPSTSSFFPRDPLSEPCPGSEKLQITVGRDQADGHQNAVGIKTQAGTRHDSQVQSILTSSMYHSMFAESPEQPIVGSHCGGSVLG
jgi:hypothetical protein